MQVKKLAILLAAASLATAMLTGCPWDAEDKTDDAASSTPGSSSRPDYGGTSDDENTGNPGGDAETPENPDQPEETKPTLDKDGYEIDENGNYTVKSEAGLLAWAQSKNVLTTDCTLADDIALTGDWTPLGDSYSNAYTGTFDGQGHTISELSVTVNGSNVGLFGYIGSDGTVQNLNLEIKSISGSYYVGGVAGNNLYGSVTDCYWQKGPDAAVGSGSADGCTPIGDGAGEVSLSTAIEKINTYLTGYQYELEGGKPVLKKEKKDPDPGDANRMLAEHFGLRWPF